MQSDEILDITVILLKQQSQSLKSNTLIKWLSSY